MNKKKKNKKPKQKPQLSSIQAGNRTQNQKTARKNDAPQQNLLTVPSHPFTATLTMLSDWHIGSGAGRPGDIDRLVQRDRAGIPYVPAKTLTGIWRDACELVALGLDSNGETINGETGTWQQWVDYLFGEQPALAETALENHPRPAAFSVRAAHFPTNFRQAIESRPVLKNALTFVKPGISIDSESGCATEDYLRFEEMVRGGAVLETTCELNLVGLNEEQQRAAYALLIAGTQMVERLGGKRRRGAGLCKLVVEENFTPWIKWLESCCKPAQPPTFNLDRDFSSRNNTQADPKDAWVRVQIKITTQTPLTISTRTVGNVVETLDYIPGTQLLPMVTKKLANLHEAIARGDLIITNATIAVDGEKGRPVPLAMFYEKLEGGWDKGQGIYNRFQENEPDKKQLKGTRQGYVGSTCNLASDVLPTYISQKDIISGFAPHNTIKDEFQRPTQDIGGIYNYENIAPGTVFITEIRLRKGLADVLSQQKTDWWQSLNGEYKIGQSKKDDYGLTLIEVSEPIKQEISKRGESFELTVWLLSDVLLRDDRLRPSTSLDDFKNELEKKLNVTLDFRAEESQRMAAIARHRRTESWQVRWGLPRPSLVGLAAGTCMVFQLINGTPDPQLLAEIEMSGIGERTAEGYGQICFNDPFLLAETSLRFKKTPSPSNSAPTNPLPIINKQDTMFKYAQIVEREAWRDAIRRASLSLAKERDSRSRILGIEIKEQEGTSKKSRPSMSQLGSLRSVLSRLQIPGDPEVKNWLNEKKWPEGSLNNQIIPSWLR